MIVVYKVIRKRKEGEKKGSRDPVAGLSIFSPTILYDRPRSARLVWWGPPETPPILRFLIHTLILLRSNSPFLCLYQGDGDNHEEY